MMYAIYFAIGAICGALVAFYVVAKAYFK